MKGNVVRSTRTGRVYEICSESEPTDRLEFVWVHCLSHKTNVVRLLVPVAEMQLIGNNYKKKR